MQTTTTSDTSDTSSTSSKPQDNAHVGKAGQAITKADRYRWINSRRDPGTLTYVSKHDLVIDFSYQRHANNDRVLKLARRWNWIACGVLIVVRREGRLHVVDGQHRLLAAMKLASIDALPCVVFDGTDVREESDAFRASNTERRPMTAVERWQSELTSENEDALFVQQLINESGRTVASHGGVATVRCVGVLLRAAGSNKAAFRRVWPIVVALCHGEVLHDRIFAALFYIESFALDGHSLSDQRWRTKLQTIGYRGVLSAINRAGALYANGGARVWGRGLLGELNKGCRTKPFRLRMDVEDEELT